MADGGSGLGFHLGPAATSADRAKSALRGSTSIADREIASRVHLSENTIKSHVQEIFRKLDVGNRVQAALKASKQGWL